MSCPRLSRSAVSGTLGGGSVRIPGPVPAVPLAGARGVQGPAAGAELPELGHQRDAGLDLVHCPAGDVEQQAVERAADQFGVGPVGPRAGWSWSAP